MLCLGRLKMDRSHRSISCPRQVLFFFVCVCMCKCNYRLFDWLTRTSLCLCPFVKSVIFSGVDWSNKDDSYLFRVLEMRPLPLNYHADQNEERWTESASFRIGAYRTSGTWCGVVWCVSSSSFGRRRKGGDRLWYCDLWIFFFLFLLFGCCYRNVDRWNRRYGATNIW